MDEPSTKSEEGEIVPAIEHPSYDEWLRVYGDIFDALPEDLGRACPMCGQQRLRLEFVARESDRVGSAFFWCANCLFGIYLFHTQVPFGVEFHRRGTSWEELSKCIPGYTIVDPPATDLDDSGGME